jgi:hypothetical protein
MTQESKPFLYTRADGFTETQDGDLAIVMRVRTKCDATLCWFQYRPNFNSEPIRIEWGAKEHVILLNAAVVPGLLRARYARVPLPSEIEAFLAAYVPRVAEPAVVPVAQTVAVVEPVAPVAAVEPAPLPTPAVTTASELAAPTAEEAAASSLPLTVANEPPAEVQVLTPAPAPASAPVEAPTPAPAPPVAAPDSVVKTPPKKK